VWDDFLKSQQAVFGAIWRILVFIYVRSLDQSERAQRADRVP